MGEWGPPSPSEKVQLRNGGPLPPSLGVPVESSLWLRRPHGPRLPRVQQDESYAAPTVAEQARGAPEAVNERMLSLGRAWPLAW